MCSLIVLSQSQPISSDAITRNACEHSTGLILFVSRPHRHFWLEAPLWLQGIPQQNHLGTLKSQAYYLWVLKDTQHTWGHTVRSQADREKGVEGEWTWGSDFISIKGGVPRVLQVHSLLMNLKHKGGNQSVQSSSQLSRSTRDFQKGELHGWGGLALNLVV